MAMQIPGDRSLLDPAERWAPVGFVAGQTLPCVRFWSGS